MFGIFKKVSTFNYLPTVLTAFRGFCDIADVPYENVQSQDLSRFTITVKSFLEVCSTNKEYQKYFADSDELVINVILAQAGIDKNDFYLEVLTLCD